MNNLKSVSSAGVCRKDGTPFRPGSAYSRVYSIVDFTKIPGYVRISAEGNLEGAKNYIKYLLRQDSCPVVVGWRGVAFQSALVAINSASYELSNQGIYVSWSFDEVACKTDQGDIYPVSVAVATRLERPVEWEIE